MLRGACGFSWAENRDDVQKGSIRPLRQCSCGETRRAGGGGAAMTFALVLATKAQIKAKLETFFGQLDGWEEEEEDGESRVFKDSNLTTSETNLFDSLIFFGKIC